MNSFIIKNIKIYIYFFFLFLTYFSSLVLFGKIALPIFDNLTYWPIHYKVFLDFYTQGKKAFDIFLAGNIKWYYHIQLFQPFTLLSLIFKLEYFLYIFDILEKSLAFYFCYILSKYLTNNKNISALISLFYSTLIHINIIYIMPGSGYCFAPYLLYLLLKNKKLRLKHYLIFFFSAISSSPVAEFGIFLIFPLAYFLKEKKADIYNLLFCFLIYLIGSLLILTPLIFSLATEEMHRVDQISQINHIEFKYISAANIISLFFIVKYFTFLVILFLGILSKNNKIKILILSIIFVYLTIYFKSFLQNILGLLSKSLLSFDLVRIEFLIPLIFTIFLIYIFKTKKNSNFHKFLCIVIFTCSITLQLSLPLSVLMANLKNSLNPEKKKLITNIFYSKENDFKKIYLGFNIMLQKKNYSKKINLFETTRTFKDYYKFNDYSFFKSIIGNKRVASLGVDPMIAVMNDIKTIDGYHAMYPKKYKLKFREIIEKEIDNNSQINNFDNWGNMVYLIYSDQNNLKINFIKAKELGADYIISSFIVNDNNLKFVTSRNGLNLYSIK